MTTDTPLPQDLLAPPQGRPAAHGSLSTVQAGQPADADIAFLVKSALERIGATPAAGMRFTVLQGWITLTGEVGRQYQKQVADEAVRFLPGVVGVSNQVGVRS